METCGDYRCLNTITGSDRYPIRTISSINDRLFGSKIFSKFDLVEAYYNIPMAEDDIKKTAVTTTFGLFEFLRMPFGLRNAAQTFQRYMDSIFRNLTYVFVYLDDILIFSKNETEHFNHIKEVLEILAQNNLRINLEKCSFYKNSLNFLGHKISADGITPLEEKVSALIEMPLPNDYASLRRFLGMIGFYRRFVPNFAEITNELYSLLSSYDKNPKDYPGLQVVKILLLILKSR